MQYTIRNVPSHLDAALRARASKEGRSLNEVALAALLDAFGLEPEAKQKRDLSAIHDSWVEDLEVEHALGTQRSIDQGLWER